MISIIKFSVQFFLSEHSNLDGVWHYVLYVGEFVPFSFLLWRFCNLIILQSQFLRIRLIINLYLAFGLLLIDVIVKKTFVVITCTFYWTFSWVETLNIGLNTCSLCFVRFSAKIGHFKIVSNRQLEICKNYLKKNSKNSSIFSWWVIGTMGW